MSILSPEELHALDRLQISTRRSILGQKQGGHKSNKKGSGLEFSEYKLYTPGDDFRSIDWNTSARSDKLFSKVFREEQDLTLVVVLDLSLSLELANILPLAKKIALALSYITIRSGDKVSLVIPGITQTKASSRPSNYHIISKLLESSKSTKNEDLFNSIKLALLRNKLPGRVVIISDFLFELGTVEKSLSYISSKNFQSSLITIRTEIATQRGQLIDSETEEIIEREINEEDILELNKLENLHFHNLERIASHYSTDLISLRKNAELSELFFKDLIRNKILK